MIFLTAVWMYAICYPIYILGHVLWILGHVLWFGLQVFGLFMDAMMRIAFAESFFGGEE